MSDRRERAGDRRTSDRRHLSGKALRQAVERLTVEWPEITGVEWPAASLRRFLEAVRRTNPDGVGRQLELGEEVPVQLRLWRIASPR